MVNDICCYVYNKHYVTDVIENTRKRVILIVKDDKIMCTKNSDVPTYSYNSSAKETINGDGQDLEKEVQNKDDANLLSLHDTAEKVCFLLCSLQLSTNQYTPYPNE